MITAETEAFLHTGCALIIGTTTVDGDPYASRGWGMAVVDAERGLMRLVLMADDLAVLGRDGATPALAVTAADVRTLRSIQLKGRVMALEAAEADDLDRADRYADAFFDDIEATDGTSRHLLERLRPGRYAACVFQVEELYDQTPGPSAGAPMAGPP